MSDPEQSRPLYAFYGDDFTGSTDVLEALALHGLSGVLFTSLPDASALAAFAHCRAIGIAGESRSRSPVWMDEYLPAVFAHMHGMGAAVNQYKVCSTFDSAPHVGSIGRAMELGCKAFGAEFVPVVVGAPHLKRWVAFGHLFAAADGVVHRIDRHPTMRRHPVTPMREADLRRHLSKQTSRTIGLADLSAFEEGAAEKRVQAEVAAGAEAVVFDGVNEAMLDETARLLWESALNKGVFAVGSSGLTYGLLRHWRRVGLMGDKPKSEGACAVERLLVLSGSCSPVTAAQIRRAKQQGFVTLRLVADVPWEKQKLYALESLSQGRSVVLYTALGRHAKRQPYGEEFGTALGGLLRELALLSGVRRILIAGGDTATHAVKQLRLGALTFAAPLVPGAPLCRSHAAGSPLDGLELVLKGGQIGREEFFAQVRAGE